VLRRLALACSLGALLAAPALSYVGDESRSGDLDGDRGKERVSTVRLPTGTPGFDRTGVRVSDRCPAGPVRVPIAGPQDDLARLRLLGSDTRRGKEVFAVLRSGAAGGLGEARVVAWRRSRDPLCRKPRQLFRYRTDRPTPAPSGTTGEVSFFNAVVSGLTRRFAGREVLLREQFLTSADPPCCGSVRKRSFYRYSARRDRYVRYKTTIEPGRP
jgi:hypothetical protein